VIATTRIGGFTALAAGAADAPLVLVLHGFPDVPHTFAPLIEALARAGHRVIAPWLRGYAPSPIAGPYDADTLAADVLAWADALSPIDRSRSSATTGARSSPTSRAPARLSGSAPPSR
jgi:pimeloyl-ACP methyl ester carboxylesterase